VSLRTQAARAVADQLKNLLQLSTTVEVLAAPPSKAATYPACSLLIDRTDYRVNDDFIPVDADNNPLVGPDATLDLPADWGRFDDQTLIYRVGRYMMHGRIFVATRHPEQRAEFEDQVFALFFADDLAPGRILLDIATPKILGRTLPWKWPVAAFLPEDDSASSWTAEFAFDERLWSWMKFDIDVDIIVPRFAPKITRLVLEFDADVTESTDPDDTDDTDGETIQVDQSGLISAYP
jgi:hypothetical protein